MALQTEKPKRFEKIHNKGIKTHKKDTFITKLLTSKYYQYKVKITTTPELLNTITTRKYSGNKVTINVSYIDATKLLILFYTQYVNKDVE